MAHLKQKNSIVKKRGYDNLPQVEYLTMQTGTTRQVVVFESEIIFLQRGTLSVISGHLPQQTIVGEGALLLLPGYKYTFKCRDETSLIIFRMYKSFIHFRSFIYSLPMDGPSVYPPMVLRHNKELSTFLDELQKDIIESNTAQEKAKDLIYILAHTYTQRELSSFFHPLLDQKYCFASFVYNNYLKVRNIQELASAYCLSLSPFYKRFRNTFGMAAYQWVMHRKNEILLYELQNGDKILKQIADDLKFLSPSQFCDYCKKHLGSAPGQIRNRKMIES